MPRNSSTIRPRTPVDAWWHRLRIEQVDSALTTSRTPATIKLYPFEAPSKAVRHPLKISNAAIINPKRGTDELRLREQRLFPYYAGYSSNFTSTLLGSLDLNSNSVVLDPWNGSGTTTRTASDMQCRAIGCDLNPAMVLIAKADLISPLEAPALVPLAKELSKQAFKKSDAVVQDDPLCKWLTPSSALVLRALETQINNTLLSADGYVNVAELDSFETVSPLAAVMYVSLFRTARRILHPFFTTNPTWVKVPANINARLEFKRDELANVFINEVTILADQISNRLNKKGGQQQKVDLYKANSACLPIKSASIDVIVTSPPYCTRIDYAVATSIELALLGVKPVAFDHLRRQLLGTSTVPNKPTSVIDEWGPTCNEFLQEIISHSSVSSTGYYYKNHAQYFAGLYDSIKEAARVIKKAGNCIVIVQDSYYKEVHNDLPKIFEEMSFRQGLVIQRREDFNVSQSMVNLNTKSRSYVNKRKTVESVLCFTRA